MLRGTSSQCLEVLAQKRVLRTDAVRAEKAALQRCVTGHTIHDVGVDSVCRFVGGGCFCFRFWFSFCFVFSTDLEAWRPLGSTEE